jgi:hypothetical protein
MDPIIAISISGLSLLISFLSYLRGGKKEMEEIKIEQAIIKTKLDNEMELLDKLEQKIEEL